jgi:hypothetical protein
MPTARPTGEPSRRPTPGPTVPPTLVRFVSSMFGGFVYLVYIIQFMEIVFLRSTVTHFEPHTRKDLHFAILDSYVFGLVRFKRYHHLLSL